LSDSVYDSSDVRVVIDERKLKKVLKGERGPVAAQVLKQCLRIETRAKIMCPVDTGRLRASITSGLVDDKDAIVGVVGTNVKYAPYLELGTIRMSARPFLVPAAYAILGRP